MPSGLYASSAAVPPLPLLYTRDPSPSRESDIIRLLLLTGCRKSEILRLSRKEAKGDRLEIRDSKTGSRTGLLNAEAQDIVERRLARGNSPWVYGVMLKSALRW